MNNPTYTVNWPTEASKFDHLKDLNLQYIEANDVELIVGVDSYFLQAPMETRQGPRGTPIAIRTRLGWLAFATVPDNEETGAHTQRIQAVSNSSSNDDCQWHLEQWVNMETVPATKRKDNVRSVEDQKAMNILRSTTKRLQCGNAFETGILLKE